MAIIHVGEKKLETISLLSNPELDPEERCPAPIVPPSQPVTAVHGPARSNSNRSPPWPVSYNATVNWNPQVSVPPIPERAQPMTAVYGRSYNPYGPARSNSNSSPPPPYATATSNWNPQVSVPPIPENNPHQRRIFRTLQNNITPKPLEISCCIFKIPQCLTRNNHNSYGYQPKIVSIGPYHNRKQQLQWIQGHKQRFQDFFVSLTGDGVELKNLVDAVAAREPDIRKSYSEDPVGFKKEKLIKMMVLDGCFILTLFIKVVGNHEDPIFSMPWVLPTIRRDLLLLENQLPLFILLTLLETAKSPVMEGLNISEYLHDIALKFFSYSFKESEAYFAKQLDHEAKHLLDLIRETFIPPPHHTSYFIPPPPPVTSYFIPPLQTRTPPSPLQSGTNQFTGRSPFLKLTLSARKLRNRGIKFEKKKGVVNTFLNISIENGVLQIPEIVLDDFISMVLLNCIAFEQLCADSTNHITSYTMFMGCLIHNESDASFLAEEGVIQNYYGTDNEVARLFRRITKDYVFDIDKSYLANVFKGVNEYAENGYHVLWAGFKYNYLDSPWIFLSTCAALALLVMTLLQVIYAARA